MRISSIAGLLVLALAQKAAAEQSLAKFVGAPACSSTSCHGGAGERNQNLIWSKRDYHSRSYATLTSARSSRFADVLKFGDATKSPRCTICHAPFESIDEKLRLTAAKPSDGVSCETCHGPAESWLRAHTRPDLTHQDRVGLGLRDLNSLYVRANTCVACHQTLDPDVAAAGHPELIFELAGQSVSEPKHWHELEPNSGAKAWFIGQAVALREISWQLSKQEKAEESLVQRWQGLLWVLQSVADANEVFAPLKSLSLSPSKENFEAVQKTSNAMAKRVSEMEWTEELTRTSLAKLIGAGAGFRDPAIPQREHARRAERIVLAIDRLTMGLEKEPKEKLNSQVNLLFKLVQSIPDFDSVQFAEALGSLKVR